MNPVKEKILADFIEKIFNPKEKHMLSAPQFTTYKIKYNNTSAIINFDTAFIEAKTKTRLINFLNGLNLVILLSKTGNNILTIDK